VLDAVFRIDDLGETDPVALVDEHHFAAGNHRVVDAHIEGFAGHAVEFDDASLSETEKVTDPER
jgi:hypothetical protein